MGGQIKDCVTFWETVTSDEWVLSNVVGIEIPLVDEPIQKSVPNLYRLSRDDLIKAEVEMEKMLKKGIIEPVESESGEWISNIFTRPKPDDTVRIILDLTEMNKFVVYEHFKMASLGTAVEMVRKGCYMCSVDLRDAYYSVPIRMEDRKYLKFYWKGVLYQYTVLPNGLACAPRFFTKILSPLFVKARKLGIQCFPYIDDIFVMGDTFEECQRSVRILCEILDDAGFVIHPEKSSLVPSQKLKFLGFMVDSVNLEITLPQDKIEKVQKNVLDLLSIEYPTIRRVAEVLGLLIAYTPAVEYGMSHVKKLESSRNKALGWSRGDFGAEMILSQEAIQDLEWWLDHVQYSFRVMRSDTPDLTMSTDASEEGWGAVCNGQSTGGRWDEDEYRHINILELEAIYLGIQTYCRQGGLHVHVATDSTTAMAYVRKMGGVRSPACNEVAMKIWNWAQQTGSWVSASFLPGVQNVEADWASRHFKDNIEWALNPKVYQQICLKFGLPLVDLFASYQNAKCELYVSWGPDPYSFHCDAFAMSWKNIDAFAFPPFSLLPRVLRKAEEEKPQRLIVVAPDWPSSHWYARLVGRAKRVMKIGRKRRNILPNVDYDSRFKKGIGLIVLMY